MSAARFLVGIDLGTTNSSIAYVDLESRGERTGIAAVLSIPQLVAPGRTEARETLPSFLYLPGPDENDPAPPGEPAPGQPTPFAGVLARDEGAVRPASQVSSAKSWLSHPTADRTARLLPWGADRPSLSPVEASARLLAHLRRAWNEGPGGGRPEGRLERQDVVLTVPASFDQEARELTLQAAREAGIPDVTLLEEPLAAFYAWTAAHRGRLAQAFEGGERVLVCDVGGGTTDFTLITVRVEDGVVRFEREAVGEHLLLGGDNLDLALARRLEARLGDRGLSLVQRLALRRSVSAAKERLLGDPGLERLAVTVLGSGRGVVGGALSTDLTHGDVVEVLTEGFLPLAARDARPERGIRTGLQEMGLPYAADPAITRHLAEFLRQAAGARPDGAGAGGMLRPDAILFNGGFFTPALARARLVDAVAAWFAGGRGPGWRPVILENQSPAAAVALGAASYALARRTGGLRVRAGSSRAYYLGVGTRHGGEGGAMPSAVCILPRGTDEGTSFRLEELDVSVVTNQPVSFPLYSSATRHDAAGDLVAADDPSLHRHAPLAAVLRYGRKSRHVELAVAVSAAFTETGTLEVACESRSSEHRWRLRFQLRGEREVPGTGDAGETDAGVQVPPERVAAAQAAIALVFGDPARAPEGFAAAPAPTPESLPALLEETLGFGRMAWPTAAIRMLADALIRVEAGRRLSARHEARWLNLAGFCLRPGFGAPLDDWRLGRMRGIYVAGLAFPSDAQCQVEWVVLWQRVAGGLKAGQQQELSERYGSLLGVRGPKGRRLNPQVQREAWRLLASLEHLPAAERVRIGEALAERLPREPGNASYLWAIGRLGARNPAYGPLSAVVPAATGEAWIDRLLSLRTLTVEAAVAVAQVGARTDDPLRDLDERARARAIARLEEAGFGAEAEPLREVVAFDERQGLQRFGEALPAGLRLTNGG